MTLAEAMQQFHIGDVVWLGEQRGFVRAAPHVLDGQVVLPVMASGDKQVWPTNLVGRIPRAQHRRHG